MWEKIMDAAVDIGSNPVSKHQIQSECVEWAGWHETGRPNLSHETKSSGVNGDKEMFPCSADHGQDWQAYPQLPPAMGAPRVCCGHASGISFPRLLWFGGRATQVTQCSVPGYSYFTMCLEKSEHNCLTSYWYTAAILARFVFIRVFKEVL